jgi:thioredoxin reductase (NADPH)
VLIATGMEVRRLDAPGVDRLAGAGVYYGAALSEAATYRDRDVVVVGGGNSAGQAAMFFSRHARKVTLAVRADRLEAGMSQYLVERVREAGNVEVLTGAVVEGVRGERCLEAVTLARHGVPGEVPAAGLFIFIGAAPRTDMVAGLVERNAQGFVLTGRDLMADGKRPRGWAAGRDPFLFETSVPGIFAAGDARQGSGKRVAAAVGEGSATVSMVHEYLQTV